MAVDRVDERPARGRIRDVGLDQKGPAPCRPYGRRRLVGIGFRTSIRNRDIGAACGDRLRDRVADAFGAGEKDETIVEIQCFPLNRARPIA
ncbi:MAG TPA: hypothetical protein VFX28_04145, partial [Methylomirabilota bacterium]|nr:hypothetical protein [Methylomirabilota bacterium]